MSAILDSDRSSSSEYHLAPEQPEPSSTDFKDITGPDPASRKRRLLLIYIHGFLGSEESFQDFPRHVHDAVTLLLDESHDVFTKVYPRYKTRGDMSIARDNFSQWLSPHEAPDLDIILLGHSLGGILAADVALISENNTDHHLKHRILGLINFDVPFLGMHPRVIPTGIGSLFDRTAEETESQTQSSIQAEQIRQNPGLDPRFDPAFPNDVRLTRWKGWGGAKHFLSKYSENLTRSIPRYARSFYDHAESMHNYPRLIARYKRVVQLENPNPGTHIEEPALNSNRVRFVNYYTESTGVIKEKKPKDKGKTDKDESAQEASPPDGAETEHDTQSDKERPDRTPDEESGKDKPEERQESFPSINSTTSQNTNSSGSTLPTSIEDPAPDDASSKPTKSRKFCYIPKSADERHLWVAMHMENMHEVTAHQSMFFPHSSHYEKLVSDTAARIEAWVQDDLTRRLLFCGLD